MGFHVIALIDCDPAKMAAAALTEIEAACDVVVRLPASTGIEVALLTGVDVADLRAAAAVLPAYGVPNPTSGVADADVPKAISRLLHKKGLHEQFLDAIVDEHGSVPPVLDAALTSRWRPPRTSTTPARDASIWRHRPRQQPGACRDLHPSWHAERRHHHGRAGGGGARRCRHRQDNYCGGGRGRTPARRGQRPLRRLMIPVGKVSALPPHARALLLSFSRTARSRR
jgi:hypothetical protein